MARTKRVAIERTPSDLYNQSNGTVHVDNTTENGTLLVKKKDTKEEKKDSQPGIGSLVICVGGIYASL
jgi:hypothetical protein